MKRCCSFLAAVCSSLSLSAAEFTDIRTDVSQLPESMRFVGTLVADRVRDRVELGPSGATFAVRYALDASVAGEEARVRISGAGAEIRAARLRGLVFGSGNLLKALAYGPESFSAADGTFDFKAAKALRMADLEKHFFNGYISLPPEDMLRYIDDLALDGINAFLCPIGVVPVDEADLTEAEKVVVRANGQRYARRIAELDCGFVNDCGSNQLPMDAPEEFRAAPNTNPKAPPTGFNGCPAKPGALAAMIAAQRKTMDELKDVNLTGFTYWPYDEGGCGCEKCRPWGCNGYLKLCEKFNAVNKAAKPNAMTILGTWFFEDCEYEGLWKYLETHDWIDYLLVDDFGEKYPEYPLKHPIPNKKTKIITFPEISMWGRIPWGGYGAVALPKFFERIFRECERVVDGFEYYSEGIYEDITKAIVTGLYIDPNTTTDAILRRYGAYHFAGADPNDFCELANLLEANHRPTLMRRENVDRAVVLAEKIDREMLPRLRGTWRWRLVWLRVMIDREMFRTGEADPEAAYPYFDEIVKISHLERQMRWVWDGMLGGWTAPRYFPKGKAKVYEPPTGDATEMLVKLIAHPQRVFVRLGKGEWKVRDLAIAKTRFDLILEDGCRLTGGSLKIGEGAKGVTVRGEGHAFADLPIEIVASTNVIVRSVVVKDGDVRIRKSEGVVVDLPPSADGCPLADAEQEIRRLDRELEWADQHAEYEKVERLGARLKKMMNDLER